MLACGRGRSSSDAMLAGGLGTAAAVSVSVQQGANLIRVHDVREMSIVARVADALYHAR